MSLRLTALSLLLLPAVTAFAADTTGNLAISAKVLAGASCRIVITPMTFGQLTSGETVHRSRNGGVGVICPDGLPYQLAFNAGEHYDADSGTRQMVSGASGIAYKLTTGGGAREWGDGDTYPAGQPRSALGYSLGTAFSVEGTAFTNAQTPAGNYTDNVTVTVSY